MQEAFGYVLFAVVLVGAVIALISLRGDRYDHIGQGGFYEDDRQGSQARAETTAVRDDEIRQMLAARNARRERQGKAPLDIEDELARLTEPAVDPGIEAEVRDMVEARNARRVRRGQPPLDVDAEVRRQLHDLMG